MDLRASNEMNIKNQAGFGVLGWMSTTLGIHLKTVRTGCYSYCFQQCAQRDLAPVSIKVINAAFASVITVYDEVSFVNNLEPPWLRVITAWRPTGKVKNLFDHSRGGSF